MTKHKRFSEIQELIGRVPRADDFISSLGGDSYRRPTSIKGVDTVENHLYRSHRALCLGNKVLCVYLKNRGDNTPHHYAERIVRSVLNIK